jgi:RimJ/RimL family protein N-acetyltransferase
VVVELAPHAYPRVLPLFADLAYHLSITAVLRETMPGRVLVDNDRLPKTALVSSPEGNYLASGASPGADEQRAGQTLVKQLRAYEEHTIELFTTPSWEPHADHLRPGCPYHRIARRRYTLTALAGAWHQHVPASLSLLRLDAATLARPAIQDHHIQRWARGNWGSSAAFLARGFGFALFHNTEPVSWCLADCAVDERCEIGIHTHPAYRRQGLATIVVAATVAEALAQGYRELGWHCGEDNQGSQAVAEKVGFKLTQQFRCLVWPLDGAR